MMQNFHKHVLGNFVMSEKDKKLYKLAKQYHEETEAYDQTVCTGQYERGRDGKTAIPINPNERRLCSWNARAVYLKILRENPGLSKAELRKAISSYRG